MQRRVEWWITSDDLSYIGGGAAMNAGNAVRFSLRGDSRHLTNDGDLAHSGGLTSSNDTRIPTLVVIQVTCGRSHYETAP